MLRYVVSSLHALKRFYRDTTATSAIIFALSAIPAMGMIGIGIDYLTALANKARLDTAADAAAIAAIVTAQNYISANASKQSDPALTNNAMAAGQAQATKVFYANAGVASTRVSAIAASAMQRSSQTLTATVTYTGAQSTAFGKMFHVPTFPLRGKAASSLTMGMYLDFYLALDMSGSMGLPTSTAGQKQLMAVNPDDRSDYPNGCQFACHFPGNQGYQTARSNNITLRVDSVGKAVQNLIQTAMSTQTLQNQYRIGIYPFIVNLIQAAALSSNFSQATQVAGALGDTYLDNGTSTTIGAALGSGGTHFTNMGQQLANYMPSSPGNGTSASSPKPFVFLVTDGVDNEQTYTSSAGWNGGSTPQQPNINSYCQYAQQQGITISILYIPYQPIYNPDTSFAGNEDGKVNAVIPSVASTLQNCASPGFFFTANSDADINSAMQAMFAQAQRAARLTQ